ncbi:MAG: hydrogenase [Phycisphaerales bacterium]|nr:hydrogenase [Phycisphaerales bacterium]
MYAISMFHTALALLLAPLLLGIINQTKAFFAGRDGIPLLQLYYDLWKLLHKGAVYSRTTSWIFRASPVVGLAAVLVGLTLVPWGGQAALLSFEGDLILLVYLLGTMRFFTVLGALDTGSSFEGMGASREVQFSALAEPALLLALAVIVQVSGSISLSTMYAALTPALWLESGPAMIIVAAAILLIYLTENARIPVDDPNTHLELTMIHEVMVLDYSGPDLAFILYAAALKLWILGSLLVGLLLPVHGQGWFNTILFFVGMLFLAVVTGVIEASMARLRLQRVPQLLVCAGALAVLAIVLMQR